MREYYDRRIRKQEMLSAADREIRLGIWKIHILHHAAAREVWGAWLLEELAEHGHKLSPGTLYPALARMEANGWLERREGAAHARARQAFRITSEGLRLLTLLRREVTELYEEVVLGAEPSRQNVRGRKVGPDHARRRSAAGELEVERETVPKRARRARRTGAERRGQ